MTRRTTKRIKLPSTKSEYTPEELEKIAKRFAKDNNLDPDCVSAEYQESSKDIAIFVEKITESEVEDDEKEVDDSDQEKEEEKSYPALAPVKEEKEKGNEADEEPDTEEAEPVEITEEIVEKMDVGNAQNKDRLREIAAEIRKTLQSTVKVEPVKEVREVKVNNVEEKSVARKDTPEAPPVPLKEKPKEKESNLFSYISMFAGGVLFGYGFMTMK